MRVYEWGPEDGRKVLFVHGISTPCLALGGLANALVEKGCRVMLFDLWGRGYSDSSDLPHDSRLYSTAILLAITSSPLPWTPGGFSLIGYSLGGGIAADFASSFPTIVKSLVRANQITDLISIFKVIIFIFRKAVLISVSFRSCLHHQV